MICVKIEELSALHYAMHFSYLIENYNIKVVISYITKSQLMEVSRANGSHDGDFFIHKNTVDSIRIYRIFVAGVQGLEPWALGFGDRCHFRNAISQKPLF